MYVRRAESVVRHLVYRVAGGFDRMTHQFELQAFKSVADGRPLAASPAKAVPPAASTGTHEFDELLKIHEYERQRLGQELHDSAGQLLVALQLRLARFRVVEPSAVNNPLIQEISDAVQHIDQELRALAFLHYPAEFGERGLCGALEALVRGFGSRTGIQTTFDCDFDTSTLRERTSIALLRIAQEALVNVHRHAHASHVQVVLRRSGDKVQLSVHDDGIGLSADALARSEGIGVRGMRHRAESLGGDCHISTRVPGTELRVQMPLEIAGAQGETPPSEPDLMLVEQPIQG
jgi:signal transduction histidine kinase